MHAGRKPANTSGKAKQTFDEIILRSPAQGNSQWRPTEVVDNPDATSTAKTLGRRRQRAEAEEPDGDKKQGLSTPEPENELRYPKCLKSLPNRMPSPESEPEGEPTGQPEAKESTPPLRHFVCKHQSNAPRIEPEPQPMRTPTAHYEHNNNAHPNKARTSA